MHLKREKGHLQKLLQCIWCWWLWELLCWLQQGFWGWIRHRSLQWLLQKLLMVGCSNLRLLLQCLFQEVIVASAIRKAPAKFLWWANCRKVLLVMVAAMIFESYQMLKSAWLLVMAPVSIPCDGSEIWLSNGPCEGPWKGSSNCLIIGICHGFAMASRGVLPIRCWDVWGYFWWCYDDSYNGSCTRLGIGI